MVVGPPWLCDRQFCTHSGAGHPCRFPFARGGASRPHSAHGDHSHRGAGTGSRGGGKPHHATHRDRPHGNRRADPPEIQLRCFTVTGVCRIRVEIGSAKKQTSRSRASAGGSRAIARGNPAISNSPGFSYGRNPPCWGALDHTQGRAWLFGSERGSFAG